MSANYTFPPLLSEAFASLTRGRHISSDDGEVFYAIQNNTTAYESIFTALGFSLRTHSRGFYFFEREGLPSEAIEQFSIFVFIMIDWMADAGISITDEILTREFVVSELPHYKTDRYSSYMARCKLPTDSQLRLLLKAMRRAGFLRADNELISFRFLPPIYRIIEAGQSALKLSKEEGTPAAAPALADGDNDSDSPALLDDTFDDEVAP